MSAPALVMPRQVRQAVVDHARRDQPRECCGFLLGTGRRVAFALPMRNVARGQARYRIDDGDHLAVRRLLRRLEPALDIVGVYHSHPRGPARPSARDEAEAYYPEWVHVIVGLAPRLAVRAFRIVRRQRPVPIRLISSRGARG